MVICNSLIDEEIAFQVMRRRERAAAAASGPASTPTARSSTRWIAGEAALEWVAPAGGVVCFPRIRADSGVDVEAFYDILTRNHGTYVGPGHWFEQPRAHFRLGFGWPATPSSSRAWPTSPTPSSPPPPRPCPSDSRPASRDLASSDAELRAAITHSQRDAGLRRWGSQARWVLPSQLS